MPGPLDALKKAQHIGPDPYGLSDIPVSQGVMPMLPAIQGLIGLFKAPEAAARVAPQIEPLSAGAVQRMEGMYQRANPVFKRLQEAGAFGGDRTVGSWPQIVSGASRAVPRASEASSRMAPVMETLGETNPEFTPMGGEGLYNVGKEAIHGLMDPALRAYTKLMGTMGR